MSAVESQCNLLLLCQALSFQEIEINEPQKLLMKKQSDKKAELISSLQSSLQPPSQSSSTCNSSRSVSTSGGGVEQIKKKIKTSKISKNEKAHDNHNRTRRTQSYKPSRNFAVFSKQNNQSLVDKVDPSNSKSIKMETLPLHLFGAFNSGHTGNLKDFVDSITTETVSFKTDSMDDPKVGRQHFMKFFEVLEEVHPDAYIVSSDMKLINHKTMTTTIYIKGTKVIASQHEHYVMKPRLVDNMNLTSLSTNDVDKLRELEHTLISQNKPIEIELVGLATFGFEDGNGTEVKITNGVNNTANSTTAAVVDKFSSCTMANQTILSSSSSSSSSSSIPFSSSSTFLPIFASTATSVMNSTEALTTSSSSSSSSTTTGIIDDLNHHHHHSSPHQISCTDNKENGVDNDDHNHSNNSITISQKKRKAWTPPLPHATTETEGETTSMESKDGFDDDDDVEGNATITPMNKDSITMMVTDDDNDKSNAIHTVTTTATTTTASTPATVAAAVTVSSISTEGIKMENKGDVNRFKNIAVIPSPELLAAAAAVATTKKMNSTIAPSMSTTCSNSSSTKLSPLLSSPTVMKLSSPFSSNYSSSPSSSSSSLACPVSKICEIQLSYYLKSFREAVIMPVS